MSDSPGHSEDRLLSLLREGLDDADPVPSDVSDFARAALAWRTIEAELAGISYDSGAEAVPSGVRSAATARMLSFETDSWTIDIEYNSSTGRLIGQVDPARELHVELQVAGGTIVSDTDDLGRFTFDGVLPGPISLIFRTPGDLEVVKTEWTVL